MEVTLINHEDFFLFTPMLHDVAASALDLFIVVSPVRKMLRRVIYFAGEVEKTDFPGRQVVVSHGFDRHHHSLEYDYQVVGLGSVTNFYNLPGLEERALTMKPLGHAMRLPNYLIAQLEEVDSECC